MCGGDSTIFLTTSSMRFFHKAGIVTTSRASYGSGRSIMVAPEGGANGPMAFAGSVQLEWRELAI